MTLSDVNNILSIFNSRDWSDRYEFHNENWKRNTWFKIGYVTEFSFLKEIINKDLQKINKEYLLTEWITFLIYNEGDFFGSHKDDDFIYHNSENRLIYSGGYHLNNDYTGGDFIINGEKLNVDIGELFIFDRGLYHEVKKIKTGVRYSLHFGVEINIKNKNLI